MRRVCGVDSVSWNLIQRPGDLYIILTTALLPLFQYCDRLQNWLWESSKLAMTIQFGSHPSREACLILYNSTPMSLAFKSAIKNDEFGNWA
jgi:hypothetical protein